MVEVMNNHGDHGAVADSPVEKKMLIPSDRLFHAPKFNWHIVTITGLKTSIDPQVIKAGTSEALLMHPRFSSKMVGEFKRSSKMEWVRTKVNLDDHIIIPNIDPHQDSPDRFVEDYASHLSTTDLDRSRPLWELHLLNIRTCDAEAMMILRVHHSVGDGASMMSFWLACMRKTSNPESLPTMPTKSRRATTAAAYSHSSTGLWQLLFTVWSFITLVWNSLLGTILFVATITFLKDTDTPIKAKPGLGATTKRSVHRIVSLDDITLVKNELNMTINDVLLGVTQAGLSSYLNCKYAECGKNHNEKKAGFPNRIRLRALITKNLRPVAGIQALSEMMAERSKAKWGNLVGFLLFPFSISHQDDPLEYVRQAKAMMNRKKHSLEVIITLSILALTRKIFGPTASASVGHRFISSTTLFFSNMVGPVEEVSYYGHPVAYIAPTVYGVPTALVIHFQSYADKMTIVVGVDPEVIPDPDLVCDHLVDSLNSIKASILSS